MATVRKAVFPAAGLGTRFLPATKAQPKEMLPLVDKPIIQYGVEEAVASGVDNIILVTGRGKNAIEDHFDVSVELETFLEARGKREQLDEVRKISNMINFAYVRQGEPLGLGHAVLVARELVGPEPFAVILGDDVIDADPPAIKQLIDVFEDLNGPVLAVERVPRDQHRVAKAERLALSHVSEVDHVRDLADLGELFTLATRLQERFELDRHVEMILDGVLAPARDEDDIRDTGGDCLFDAVLNDWLVDEREHLLRLRLGRRKETGTQAGNGKDGLADGRIHARMVAEVSPCREYNEAEVEAPGGFCSRSDDGR